MITIIGAGRVGSSTAMKLAEMNLDDITLVDVVQGLPQGEALDISQSCNFDVKVRGSNDFGDIRGSSLIINTAGLARKPGMTRTDLANKNAEITRSLAEHIKTYAPGAVVLQVANPVDLMALVMMKATGFPRERIVGMGGLLDSQRLSYFISRELRVPVKTVNAFVMGEHGETMVPVFSQARAGGRPLKEILKPGRLLELTEKTRNAGAEVIGLKGSTFYAPSVAIARMAEAIIKDKKAVLPASVYLKGEYGILGIFLGVPVVLGKSGMEKVVKVELDDEETAALMDSCKSMFAKAKELGLDLKK